MDKIRIKYYNDGRVYSLDDFEILCWLPLYTHINNLCYKYRHECNLADEFMSVSEDCKYKGLAN